MKNILLVLSTIGLFFLLGSVPSLNEEWINKKLDPSFNEFKNITFKKYPNKIEREAAFAKVIADKNQIVKANTWPFVACKVEFLAFNSGTLYRKDVRKTSCWLGW